VGVHKENNLFNKDSKRIIDLLSGSSLLFRTNYEKQFLTRFVSGFSKARYSNKIDLSLSFDIAQIIPFDEPDLLIYYNNILYAIEHFSIDASLTTKKGSSFKKKYNDKNSELKEHKNDGLRTTKISTPLNFSNLTSNFKSCFTNHYNKISNYNSKIRNYLTESIDEINYIFLIEYDLIFPSFFMKSNKMNYIFPDNDIDIINFLASKNNLSGIICFFKGDNHSLLDYTRFIALTKENISEYQIDEMSLFNTQNMEIHDFESPMFSSVTFSIPIEK